MSAYFSLTQNLSSRWNCLNFYCIKKLRTVLPSSDKNHNWFPLIMQDFFEVEEAAEKARNQSLQEIQRIIDQTKEIKLERLIQVSKN